MNRVRLKRYKTLLSGRLDALVGTSSEAVAQMEKTEESAHPDPNDRAAVETERSFGLRLRDRDRKLIGKIEDALRRIDRGTFGVCEECGGQISEARLKARPVTTLCIDCKEEAERRERRA